MLDIMIRHVSTDRPRHPFAQAVDGDAGYDLYNAGPSLTLHPGQSLMVPSNIAVKIPRGYVGIITARSSTFRKKGVFVVQGIIDSGYTGELFSFAWHPRLEGFDAPVQIESGERISQMIVVPFLQSVPFITDHLPETVRGSNGFGSTGR